MKKNPSSKLAARVERLHKRLSPLFPNIDPHDLEMILTSLLRRRRERMEDVDLMVRDHPRLEEKLKQFAKATHAAL